jgi:hypothetical protein
VDVDAPLVAVASCCICTTFWPRAGTAYFALINFLDYFYFK